MPEEGTSLAYRGPVRSLDSTRVRDRGGIRAARRRARARAEAGFSLIELLVVVLLISILAAMAFPALQKGRDDRFAFDQARNYELIIHEAKIKAQIGAAHLVTITTESGSRGKIDSYMAVDTTAPPDGPKKVGTCKNLGEWNNASAAQPAAAQPPNVNWVNGWRMDSALPGAVINTADIKSQILFNGTAVTAVAICFSAGAETYATSGSTAQAAANAISPLLPFTGAVEVQFQRHDAAGQPLGSVRKVTIAGSSSPTIRSQ